MKKILLFLAVALMGLVSVAVYQKFTLEDGKLHVVFCDVGQGDAIFVKTPDGSDILIDGGPDNKVLTCLSRHMPFWDRTIELAVLTHPHADHLNGLVDVIERYSILYFVAPQSGIPFRGKNKIEESEGTEGEKVLRSKIVKKKIQVRQLAAGDVTKLTDGTKLDVIWPDKGVSSVADVNDASLVLLLSYKDVEVLLTGDASSSLLNREVEDVDILKVPHHGSRTGLSGEFLDRVRPRLSVITVGKGNRFGHPHEEVLKILRDRNIRILRTDVDGEIEVVSDGQRWWTKKFRN